MHLRRFYVPHREMKAGEMIRLSPRESHHLVRVLRLDCGTTVSLFNGRGKEVWGVVESANPTGATVRITQASHFTELSRETKTPVDLILPLLKAHKLEIALRMATEFGASGFWLFTSEHSVPIPQAPGIENKLRRWEYVILEAVRLSGRTILPRLSAPSPLGLLLPELAHTHIIIFAYEGENLKKLSDILSTLCSPSGTNQVEQERVCIVTGPEGGFTPGEVDMARRCGAYLCSLGRCILRAETAPIAALSVMLAHFGEV